MGYGLENGTREMEGDKGGSGGKKWKGESDAIIFLIDFIKIEKRISNSLYMYEIVNKFN